MLTIPSSWSNSMENQLPSDQIELLASALHSTPTRAVRFNQRKLSQLHLSSQQVGLSLSDPVLWCANASYLAQKQSVASNPYFFGGAFYVQEPSSMLLHSAFNQLNLEVNSGLKALDLCAAPGGKSTLLLDFLGESDLLVANDINRLRADTLTENISRWGMANVVTTSNQPQDFASLQGYFDCVLVDAPCSGEGLWRKTPQSVDEWSVDNVTYCALRQKDIVRDVLPALKSGGYFIYSTCTYNSAENEDIVNWLTSEGGLETVDLTFPTQWGLTKSNNGGFHCYPHKVRGEGFFFCVLKKPQSDESIETQNASNNEEKSAQTKLSSAIIPHYKQKNIRHKKTAFQALRGKGFTPQFSLQKLKQQPSFLKQWFDRSDFVWRQFRDELVVIPSHLIQEFEYLSETLKAIKLGLRVGKLSRKGSEWILQPHIDLARFSSSLNSTIPQISLNYEEAQVFITTQKLVSQPSTNQSGWHLITYKGLGLGWQKIAKV